MNTEPADWVSGPAGAPRPPRPAWRSARVLAVAGLAAVVLAVGGVAVAAAATSDPTPSPSASPSASPGSTSAPERGPRERRPVLAGTVVSAAGNTITITDFQGFQRTIRTTSATTYADGLTATPAAGTRIYAVGAVDSDKTSLKAARVGKLPDRAEGHRFPGYGFPGDRKFPGERRHGPPPAPGTPSPGTGSPTPSPTA